MHITDNLDTLQARASRNLLQYAAPSPAPAPCTVCVSVRRASGVSAQDCVKLASKLLPGA